MKIMKFTSIGFLIGFLLAQCSYSASATNHDDWDTKTYDISNFTKLHIEGSYKVFLRQGDAPELKIESTNPDVFHELDIDDDGESLRLTISEDWFQFKPITLYITFVDLEEIYVEGGVKLNTNGYVDLKDVFIHIEGGAKIEMDIKADYLSVEGEGGILFDLEGVTKQFKAKISGAGHINARDLKANDVDIKIEGVGTASVYAVDNLDAKIEGLGKVKYLGHPHVHKNIEGLGVVTHD